MGSKNTDTIVLLPAHNEREDIEGVIRAVRDRVCGATVAVVDDGSEDDTAELAEQAGAMVLRLPCNMGYGVALQTGYKYALANGYEYLVQLDSDGQHDAAGIPALLDVVKSGTADLCIGSRFLEGDTYTVPAARRAGMVVLRRVASALIGQTITDPTSGFQAMNGKVISFFARDLYPVDYPDTDVIVLLHQHGFKIAEAPVVMYPSSTGKSIHAGVRPLYYLFKMSLAIPLNLLRRES